MTMFRIVLFLCLVLQFMVSAFNTVRLMKKLHREQLTRSSKILVGQRGRETALQLIQPELGAVEGFAEAFVGGTVGVMSVMFMLEIKKKDDLNLESCPYCMGNGEILCATCMGCTVSNGGQCPSCNGRGLITCINCKGDGRITPILLQSKSVRNPEFAADKVSIDSP